MLQGDIDRLDDATAAAGRFDFAYQPPPLAPDRQPPATTEMLPMPLGNPLPEGPLGLELPPAGVVPSDSVAWQNAIEQLLRLIGPDQPGSSPDDLAPAAYVGPLVGEAEAAAVPPPMPADPGPIYIIESLGSDEPPLLSLDEGDLFGDAEPQVLDLRSVTDPAPAAAFQGIDSDLFGPTNGVDPISIGKNDERSIKPTAVPPGSNDIDDGYISLLGKPAELKLTLDEARGLANENGELFIDGDGDDVAYLSGNWVFVGERPEKGAIYYTDAAGTLEVTFANTETVLV